MAAHALWRRKGLRADLIIVNEQDDVYFSEFQEQIRSIVTASDDRDVVDKPGGVHLKKASHLSAEDRLLFDAAARCALAGVQGNLAAQPDRREQQSIPGERRSHPKPDWKPACRRNRNLRPPPTS